MILGDGAVGKTSMLNRFVDSEFSDMHLTTLGLDFKTKKYTASSGK